MNIIRNGYRDHARDLAWYAIMRLRQFFPDTSAAWTMEMLWEDIEE